MKKKKPDDTPYPEIGNTASEVRDAFSETLSRVAYGKERIPVYRHGKRVAVLIPPEDLDLIQQAEQETRLPWLKPKQEKVTKEFIRSLQGCLKGPKSALDLLLAERRNEKAR